MRLVRSRAADWGIDPKRIGIMGFSAGGEVVSMVTYAPDAANPEAVDPIDRISSRPDFQINDLPWATANSREAPCRRSSRILARCQ